MGDAATDPEPTSLVLFSGDVTDENTRIALFVDVTAAAMNMGFREHKGANMTQTGMLWSSLTLAPTMHTDDGGACRTIPIPRPVDIAGGLYHKRTVESAAKAFRPGVYTGQMYLALSNPKWVPCLDDPEYFNPRKGQCTAEFGLCNLRHVHPPRETLAEATPSFVSRWVSEFRAVFQC